MTRISQSEKDTMLQLYDEGYGYVLIGRMIGRGESSVRDYLRRAGRRGRRDQKGIMKVVNTTDVRKLIELARKMSDHLSANEPDSPTRSDRETHVAELCLRLDSQLGDAP